jgi:predicted ArsR family transcriptional regulator
MARPFARIKEGTSGRILELLRRTPKTIDELAGTLEITRTAVRAQVARLEHDGLVEQRGSRRGASKPSRVYGLTAEAELLFSKAYVPILTQLLHVLAERLDSSEFDAVMHEVGRGLVDGHTVYRGQLRKRVQRASVLLNEFGGLTEVEEIEGGYLIRSHGCPLAAATAGHPEVCNALESLVSEFVGSRTIKCCDRYDRVRCCFEIPEEENHVSLDVSRNTAGSTRA